MLQSLWSRIAGVDSRGAISMASVLAAAAAILLLVFTAPPAPSDAVQASLMYRLVTSL